MQDCSPIRSEDPDLFEIFLIIRMQVYVVVSFEKRMPSDYTRNI